MSRPHNFSKAQIARMVEWRREGKSYGWIAMRFGCVPHTVRRHCLVAGLKATPRPIDKFPAFSSRNGVQVRRFTQEDDALLLELQRQAMRPSEIGRALGRDAGTIRNRLIALSAYEATP